jgi:hypothetical protein
LGDLVIDLIICDSRNVYISLDHFDYWAQTDHHIEHRRLKMYGARMIPVHRVIPDALAEVLRKAPLTDEKVAFAWRSSVGPAIDRGTSVTLRDGVLHVVVRDAAWGREVERSQALIHARLDALLGPGVVRALRVGTT